MAFWLPWPRTRCIGLVWNAIFIITDITTVTSKTTPTYVSALTDLSFKRSRATCCLQLKFPKNSKNGTKVNIANYPQLADCLFGVQHQPVPATVGHCQRHHVVPGIAVNSEKEERHEQYYNQLLVQCGVDLAERLLQNKITELRQVARLCFHSTVFQK